jgi:hypothetical protein
LSVADFTTNSVQANPSGGEGTVNEGVPIGSILMPSSHQKPTWFESVARAVPVNGITKTSPMTRAVITTTAPFRRKRNGMMPSPLNCRPDH